MIILTSTLRIHDCSSQIVQRQAWELRNYMSVSSPIDQIWYSLTKYGIHLPNMVFILRIKTVVKHQGSVREKSLEMNLSSLIIMSTMVFLMLKINFAVEIFVETSTYSIRTIFQSIRNVLGLPNVILLLWYQYLTGWRCHDWRCTY